MLTSCQPSNPSDPLFGRWEAPDYPESGWIEFNQDGSMAMFEREEYPEGWTLTLPYTHDSNTIFVRGEEFLKYRFDNGGLLLFVVEGELIYEDGIVYKRVTGK